jgi:hypothetical protein
LLSYTGGHDTQSIGVLLTRTLRHFVISAAAGTFLLHTATPLSAQTAHEPTDLDRRFARHFPEKPPVQFEFAEDAEHRPLIIITNLHQFLLTAYVVQTEPRSADDHRQTLIYDALPRTGGLVAPIPRGLSHKIGIPHIVGDEPAPDAKLVAAVWEDGSTFGPDELLSRIANSRKALADSFDLAIVALQTGLEKNWSVQEYLAAAQKLKPPMPPQMATAEEAMAASEKFTAQVVPSRTITVNMQHAVELNRSPAQVAKLAQNLLKQFEESRESLRQALSRPSPSADKPISR